MDIDDYWLDDAQMVELSQMAPPTAWGRELLDEWPRQRYRELVQSEAYRGAAAALCMIITEIAKQPLTLRTVVGTIQAAQEQVGDSKKFPANTPGLGAAALTLMNAWEAALCGVTPEDAMTSYQSEAIVAARKFCEARSAEGNPV